MQMIRHLGINRSWYTVINNIKGTQEEGTMLARDKTSKLAMFILVHSADSANWSVIKNNYTVFYLILSLDLSEDFSGTGDISFFSFIGASNVMKSQH